MPWSTAKLAMPSGIDRGLPCHSLISSAFNSCGSGRGACMVATFVFSHPWSFHFFLPDSEMLQPLTWVWMLAVCLHASLASPNVLFIMVDDLRPELGAYGFPNITSPNIDQLARTGTLFRRAYCQMSSCSPSRASLLTSRRPATTQVYDLSTYFRTSPGQANATTLPQYFKNKGYRTAGMGKIFHPGSASGNDNDAISWTEPYFQPLNTGQFRAKDKSWDEINQPETSFPDGQVASNAVQTLQSLAGERFFVAVGFYKPHLPFVVPPGFLDLYPTSGVPLAGNQLPPTDLPDIAWIPFSELREYGDIAMIPGLRRVPGNFMPDSKAIELRRAYWAATSYIDKQVSLFRIFPQRWH